MVTDEIDDEPESGNKVPTPESRKILAAGRPYGTGNLRGMHGYFIGALYGNMQGERIGISR